MLKKEGTPQSIRIVKEASFTMDENLIARSIERAWPERSITVDQLHEAIKSMGIVGYSSDDLASLMGRLTSLGFKISG